MADIEPGGDIVIRRIYDVNQDRDQDLLRVRIPLQGHMTRNGFGGTSGWHGLRTCRRVLRIFLIAVGLMSACRLMLSRKSFERSWTPPAT